MLMLRFNFFVKWFQVKKYFIILVIVMVGVFAGCNSNSKVSGHVTFEDGSPLKTGTVIFDSGTHQAKGDLNDEGFYQLGSLKEKDGLPAGQYKVYITGAMEGGKLGPRGSVMQLPQQLIDTLFTSPNSSGLDCEVKGNITFDITVKPPQKK